MIDAVVLFKVFSVFVIALVLPGPDFLVITATSLTRGRAAGVKAALGVSLVNGVYAAVSLAGLAILLERFLWLTAAMKVCGGLYLIYIGVALWRASMAPLSVEGAAPALPFAKSAFATGALCTLTNPKAIMFFASIFALALTPETSLTTRIVLGGGVPALAFLWFSFVAFSFSRPAMSSCYGRWRKAFDRLAGGVMAGFGVRLLLSANE